MKNLNYLAHQLTGKKPPATLSELKANRAELRAKVLDMIGLNPMPKKTPLNVKFVGDKVDLGGCYFQRVVFESRPQIYVAAHLYLPKNVKFPVPAVIQVPGHSRRDRYRAHSRTYAENGFVAIGLPMVGEEGRRGSGWNSCGEWGPYVGHLNWYNTGYTPIAPTVWDGIRAVDFLLTLKDKAGNKLVDETQIGMTGLSGGSARTLWTTIADPRISVAVVNQGLNAIEGYNTPVKGISSTCDIHLFYNYYGLSCGEIYSLIAPRKFLLQHGTRDRLYPNPQPVVDYLKTIYKLYEQPDNFAFETYDQGHGYSEPLWNAENSWMDRWLRQGRQPLKLYGRFDAELTCFPDGEPSDIAHTETLFTPVTPQWDIKHKSDLDNFRTTLLKAMRQKIIRTAFLPIDSEMKPGNISSEKKYNIEPLELGINNRSIIHQGYYLYKPNTKRKTVILVANEPIDYAAMKKMFEDDFLPNKFNLYYLEITGTGHNPWSTAKHWQFSRFAELCGQTQASLQINDLLAAVKHLKQFPTVDAAHIYLWGRANISVPVLYSAVVNADDIAGVILTDAPDQHIGITPVEDTKDKIALFAILNYADIPQVAGLIYPRPLILTGNIKSGFAWTHNIYKKLGLGNNFITMKGKSNKILETVNTLKAVSRKEQSRLRWN